MAHENIDKKESNKALIVSGIIIILLIAALLTNGFGLFNKKKIDTQQGVELSIGSSPVLGEETAPLTVYVFSDFSCPYCAAAAGFNDQIISQLKAQSPTWEPALPRIEEEYVKTGKVKIVYKYLTGHGTGKPAHRVAWCLNDQDLFWEFHDLAYANQNQVTDIDKMRLLAQQAGANMTQLQECLDSQKYEYQFNLDEAMAASYGLDGTPSFVINDQVVSGAIPYSQFKKIIDKEL